MEDACKLKCVLFYNFMLASNIKFPTIKIGTMVKSYNSCATNRSQKYAARGYQQYKIRGTCSWRGMILLCCTT